MLTLYLQATGISWKMSQRCSPGRQGHNTARLRPSTPWLGRRETRWSSSVRPLGEDIFKDELRRKTGQRVGHSLRWDKVVYIRQESILKQCAYLGGWMCRYGCLKGYESDGRSGMSSSLYTTSSSGGEGLRPPSPLVFLGNNEVIINRKGIPHSKALLPGAPL